MGRDFYIVLNILIIEIIFDEEYVGGTYVFLSMPYRMLVAFYMIYEKKYDLSWVLITIMKMLQDILINKEISCNTVLSCMILGISVNMIIQKYKNAHNIYKVSDNQLQSAEQIFNFEVYDGMIHKNN